MSRTACYTSEGYLEIRNLFAVSMTFVKKIVMLVPSPQFLPFYPACSRLSLKCSLATCFKRLTKGWLVGGIKLWTSWRLGSAAKRWISSEFRCLKTERSPRQIKGCSRMTQECKRWVGRFAPQALILIKHSNSITFRYLHIGFYHIRNHVLLHQNIYSVSATRNSAETKPASLSKISVLLYVHILVE